MGKLWLLPFLVTFSGLLSASSVESTDSNQLLESGFSCPVEYVEGPNSDAEVVHASFIQHNNRIFTVARPSESVARKPKPNETSVDSLKDKLNPGVDAVIESFAPGYVHSVEVNDGLSVGAKVALMFVTVAGIVLAAYLLSSGFARAEKEPEDEPVIPDEEEAVPMKWRTITACLVFAVQVFNYSDRYNISVAILELSAEKGYSEFTQGFIQASFYLGFLVSATIFGLLASPDSGFGAKRSLIIACTAWSISTVLTPAAADISVECLIFARIALGFAEGASYPCTMALISTWFPPAQRAQVASLANCGQSLGAALAMACSPITAQNWRIMFYVFGGIGLGWVALFSLLGADSPDRHQHISKEELAYIQRHLPNSTKNSESASFLRICMSSAFWALATADVAYSLGWYILISWTPTYYSDQFGLGTAAAGELGMCSYLIAALSVLGWGKLFDSMLRWYGSSALGRIRLAAVAVCLVGPSITSALLTVTIESTSMLWQGVLLTLSVVFLTAAWSGTKANVVDIGGSDNAARIAGLVNTLASVPGVFGNVAVGYYLSKPSLGWPAVFLTMIAANIVGFIAYTSGMKVERVQF